MVLGASSDFACRVWNLADRRLKVNLTGHADRLLAGRFFGGGAKSVVTSSIDRTIKVCVSLFTNNNNNIVRTPWIEAACNLF